MPLAGQRNRDDNIDSHNNNLLNNLMMIIIILYAVYRDKVAIWECSKFIGVKFSRRSGELLSMWLLKLTSFSAFEFFSSVQKPAENSSFLF